jgi:hypothetical protein
LNTERTDEMRMKIVASTKWRPGQILLPMPNTNESFGSSRTLPSSLRKRSGLNSSGSKYISGSWRIALKISQIDIQIVSYGQPDDLPCISYHYRSFWTKGLTEISQKRKNAQLKISLTFRNEIASVNIIPSWQMGDSCNSSFVIPAFESHRRLRIVPVGVTICHLINSLHNASMYGRRGLSSNVGSRSLPTTTSSSACARLCTCGKSARARKKEVIEDTALIIILSKK